MTTATAKTTAGQEEGYIPTYRDETAMDGAPRAGLVRMGEQAKATATATTKANTGILHFVQDDDVKVIKVVPSFRMTTYKTAATGE